jgi:hypothetical protein
MSSRKAAVKRRPADPSPGLREEVALRLGITERSLPHPLRLGHYQVVVTPIFWVLIFDREFGDDAAANHAQMRGVSGVEGPLLASFRAALVTWLNRHKPGVANADWAARLSAPIVDCFIALGEAVGEPSDRSPEELFDHLTHRLRTAGLAVDALVGEFLRQSEGPRYGDAYARRRRLDASEYPGGLGDTMGRVAAMNAGGHKGE